MLSLPFKSSTRRSIWALEVGLRHRAGAAVLTRKAQLKGLSSKPECSEFESPFCPGLSSPSHRRLSLDLNGGTGIAIILRMALREEARAALHDPKGPRK